MKRNSCRFFSSSLFQKTKSFTRVVDGFFSPHDPLDLLAQKSFKPVPSVIGVNNHECGFPLPVVRTPAVPPSAPSAARQLFAHTGHAHRFHPALRGLEPFTQVHSLGVLLIFPLSEGGELRIGGSRSKCPPCSSYRFKETTLLKSKRGLDPFELCSKHYKRLFQIDTATTSKVKFIQV